MGAVLVHLFDSLFPSISAVASAHAVTRSAGFLSLYV